MYRKAQENIVGAQKNSGSAESTVAQKGRRKAQDAQKSVAEHRSIVVKMSAEKCRYSFVVLVLFYCVSINLYIIEFNLILLSFCSVLRMCESNCLNLAVVTIIKKELHKCNSFFYLVF